MVAGGVLAAKVPLWIGFVYGIVSLVTALCYAWDKYKASGVRRRTRETTLHLLELLGGWPGALLAQRILRHKNRKFSYQRTFWAIVILHLGVWILVVVMYR